MDKIKDFFHDFSDVFFAVAVTGVMIIVLSLNLGNWFNNSSNTVLADEPIQIVENNDTDPISQNDNEQAISEDEEESDTNHSDTDETSTEEVEDIHNNNNNDNIESNETETQPDNTPITSEVKTIVIPNGTPGSGVAKILKENGLIDNTNEFIQTAESLNLAIRLKSGSFEISTDATIEDMVKIIAGQKK